MSSLEIFITSLRLLKRRGMVSGLGLGRSPSFVRGLILGRVGVAFCVGLSWEASKLDKVLEAWGVDVYSVACKCGAVDKTKIGLEEKDKLKPGLYEPMCNPFFKRWC